MRRTRKITVRLCTARGRCYRKVILVQHESDGRTWREYAYAAFPFVNPLNVEVEEPDQWQ